jgi:hypothetical protein
VSDSLPAGQFAAGSPGIDVDPLKISGCLGKLVDFLLVDDYPVRKTDFPAFEGFGIFN